MPKTDFAAVLRVLAAHRVDFIVVGGVSAVLQGAPVNTFDLDVLHGTQAGNHRSVDGRAAPRGTPTRGELNVRS